MKTLLKNVPLFFISALLIALFFLHVSGDPLLLKGENFVTVPEERMEECFKNADERCFYDIAANLLDHLPLRQVLDDLSQREQEEARSQFFFSCHTLAHHLGRIAYARSKNIPELYIQCSQVCGGGCYHGVIEEYLQEKKLSFYQEEGAILEAMGSVCSAEQGIPELYNQCFHGTGHAFMLITEGDLRHSLEICDAFATKRQREYCYSGVFMEYNVRVRTPAVHSLKIEKNGDSLYPCTILQEQHLEVCYYLSAQRFLSVAGNWEDIIGLCDTVPLPYQNACMYGAGMVLASGGASRLLPMRKGCGLILQPSYQEACRQGVIHGLFYRFDKPIYTIKLAHQFCSGIDSRARESCYQMVGHQVRGWVHTDKELSMLCETISNNQYVTWCKEGGKIRMVMDSLEDM